MIGSILKFCLKAVFLGFHGIIPSCTSINIRIRNIGEKYICINNNPSRVIYGIFRYRMNRMEFKRMCIYMPKNAIWGMFKVNGTFPQGGRVHGISAKKGTADIITG
jgi:hypothetical protein